MFFISLFLTFLLGLSFTLNASDLKKVIDGLPNRGDGAFLRTYPDGFRIYGVGTAAIDMPEDPNAVLRAEKLASSNARKALSEYISQSLSASESASKEFHKAELTNEREGEETTKQSKTFGIEEFKSEVSSGTQSLMRGVVTLKAIVIEKGKHSYSKVLVGYSSKTLVALDAAANASVSLTTLPQAVTSAVEVAAQAESHTQEKEEWIICMGHGPDRERAVQAAIIEGIQQVYGAYLENNETYKSRFAMLKQNGVAQLSESTQTTQDTVTQTKGFIDEYRIISVEPVQAGFEAKIQAKFVNPRAGGLKTLIVYPMEMPLSKSSRQYTVSYKQHLTGAELEQLCYRRFEHAFASTNRYIILNNDDVKDACNELHLAQNMVQAGKSSPAELSRIGRILTADFFVRISFNTIQYSRKLVFSPKAQKLTPSHRLFFSVDYNLIDVKTGETRLQNRIDVVLNNEFISSIKVQDEDMTDEEFSDRILNAAIDQLTAKLAQDAHL